MDNETQLTSEEIKSLRLVKDELEIRALADKFSDAANRKDGEAFQSLWATAGVWKIGPPINMEFKGKENMGASITHMLGLWDFFVQLTGPGVITITADKATARFYVNEIARKTEDKSGNYNLSMYDDELIKENGRWVFLKRTYYTIYQDATTYDGLIQELPKLK
ncbi:MAG: nuclear transport factor 2 family protein [Rhizobacter sp.]|nr:nuclear transport factor 2 family protein [Chlorobiales bacterium]